VLALVWRAAASEKASNPRPRTGMPVSNHRDRQVNDRTVVALVPLGRWGPSPDSGAVQVESGGGSSGPGERCRSSEKVTDGEAKPDAVEHG
jgi:hypothetical protein